MFKFVEPCDKLCCRENPIFTVRNSSCWKFMFSQVSVCPQGEVYTPLGRRQTPPGRHLPPADGHCSWSYASYWNPFLFRECTYYLKWKIPSERKSGSESNILLLERTSVFLMAVHASQRIWDAELKLCFLLLQEIISFSSKTDKWWGNCPSFPLQIGSIILDEGSSNNNHFTINLFGLLLLFLCAGFWMKFTLLLCR